MELLLDLLLIAACVAFGFWQGFRMATRFHLEAARNIFEKLGITEQQMRDVHQQVQREFDQLDNDEEGPECLEIKIEKHAEQLFAYRKQDGQFLAQATDSAALIELLKTKFKDQRVTITPEDGAEHIVART